jgi:hypothetical protein
MTADVVPSTTFLHNSHMDGFCCIQRHKRVIANDNLITSSTNRYADSKSSIKKNKTNHDKNALSLVSSYYYNSDSSDYDDEDKSEVEINYVLLDDDSSYDNDYLIIEEKEISSFDDIYLLRIVRKSS